MNKIFLLLLVCISCLTGSAQILNSDFENWFTDTDGHVKLYNWQHLDFGIPNTGFFATHEVNDAEHGSNALELSRWYSYRSDWVMQKASIASRPGFLNGYYKYTDNHLMSPYDIDTAIACIWLTVWNNIAMQNDTVGTGRCLLMASDTYIPFMCPISYTDPRIPDSFIILIKPSVWYNNAVFCRDPGLCSSLTIDNLSLVEPSAVKNIDNSHEVAIYPNPSSNELAILATHKISDVVIYNMIGQAVYNGQYNDEKIKINIAAFPAGIYTVILTDDEGEKVVKKIIK